MKKHKERRWRRSGRKNRHHIKNKCRGGNNSPSNILILDTERHKAFHFLFGNLDFLEVAALLERTHRMKALA